MCFPEPVSRTSTWIRRFHRWVSIAFTLAVIANFVALGLQYREVWVGFMALLPLALLMFTGLYMFVRPYVLRWRNRRAG